MPRGVIDSSGKTEVTPGSAVIPQDNAQKEVAGKYDHELAKFQSFGPNLRREMGYVEEDDPRVVRNVPADMTITWATDPRVDAGAHLSFVQGLGFRPVRVEEVTTGFGDAYKMVLRSYEVGPHDYVVVGGGVLMVGYRQYREDRRAAARLEAQTRLDGNRDNLSNAGVEYVGRSKSAPMTEVR